MGKLSEFDVIRRYFTRANEGRSGIIVGVGDDAAVLEIPPKSQLVTSIDTSNVGVHFLPQAEPEDIAYKSLAVSLSDMAAMGAQPHSALLSLTLSFPDEEWLQAFAKGFFELADTYNVILAGGDISHGPLSVTTVLNGWVPENKAILRSGAQVGDKIYISGVVGEAGFALAQILLGREIEAGLLQRLNRPQPRVAQGLGLRGIASAAIDISDGLLADLTKLVKASGMGAVVYAGQLPRSKYFPEYIEKMQVWEYALTAGDDYELCFTVSPENEEILEKRFAKEAWPLIAIGEIIEADQVTIYDEKQQPVILDETGYDHFKE